MNSQIARRGSCTTGEVKNENDLNQFPVVAIVGVSQVGKTTLAKEIVTDLKESSVYLNEGKSVDYDKLNDAYLYLRDKFEKLIIIDELQLRLEQFQLLRSIIGEDKRNGRFLILGSALPRLLNKSSQSLTRRIRYHELSLKCTFEELGFFDFGRRRRNFRKYASGG